MCKHGQQHVPQGANVFLIPTKDLKEVLPVWPGSASCATDHGKFTVFPSLNTLTAAEQSVVWECVDREIDRRESNDFCKEEG